MGRLVLLMTAGVASLAVACAPAAEGPERSSPGGDPHAALTCTACHEYSGLKVQTRFALDQLVRPDSVQLSAPVPESKCATVGCHQDLGPREVELPPVAFQHRRHGGDTIVVMECVGCHGHSAGGEPLTASVDPCSLCHLGEQAAGNDGECRVCHTSLEHAGVTSQGLSVPHEGLPWVEGGCVRCHYDVTAAPTEVSVLSCRKCHEEDEDAVARGIGEDLHGTHAGVGCLSCHEGETHRIQAMSSSVSLQCQQCHQAVHAISVARDFPTRASCNACHQGVHATQQRMVLGLLPGVASPQPSEKFLDGLTCRSCHVPQPSDAASVPVGGSDAGCTDCHRREYGKVLDWWRNGSSDRLRLVRSALARASGDLDRSPAAETRLDSARILVELVDDGVPVHNLLLAHRLLVRASDEIHQAYLDAGRSPPAPPELGREPHMGLCSYCHYRLNDPWLFEEMSGDFHREVLGQR